MASSKNVILEAWQSDKGNGVYILLDKVKLLRWDYAQTDLIIHNGYVYITDDLSKVDKNIL